MPRHIIQGWGTPSTKPDAYGQHYIDRQNERIYIAVGVDAYIQWQLLNSNAGNTPCIRELGDPGEETTPINLLDGCRQSVTYSADTGSFTINLKTIEGGNTVGGQTEVWVLGDSTLTGGFNISVNADDVFDEVWTTGDDLFVTNGANSMTRLMITHTRGEMWVEVDKIYDAP